MQQVFALVVEAQAEVIKAADALQVAREQAAADLAEIKTEEIEE